MVSHRKHEGVEPWTPIDIPDAVSTGPALDLDPAAYPIAFGVRAAELQRAVLQRLPFARRPVSIVGGALEHVEIGPDGVRSQTLGGWFDRLGERLNPAAKFSASGAMVRARRRFDLWAWLAPTSLAGMMRFGLAAYMVLIGVRLALAAPAAIYVERTCHGSPQTVVETGAGEWSVWTRLDLGKLITAPALGRKSTVADLAEVARLALTDAGRDCEIAASREIMLDEYEHQFKCK